MSIVGIHTLEILGEAAKKVPAVFQRNFPEIP